MQWKYIVPMDILVSFFISERTNKRQDEFGGCFENRMRLPKLIIENIRKKQVEHLL